MKTKKMSFRQRLVSAGVAVSTGLAVAANAAVAVPTPDYTDFEAIVGVGLAVTLVVMLARKGKAFLK